MVEPQPGEEPKVSNPAVRTVQIAKDILVPKLLFHVAWVCDDSHIPLRPWHSNNLFFHVTLLPTLMDSE